MKKKFALLCAVAGVVGAFSAPSASFAACNDGDSRHQNVDPVTGEPTGPSGNDTIVESPTGTIVYGDGAEENLNPGYLGATGSSGYIEISGNNDADPNVQVDGADSGGRLEGRVGADTGGGGPDACVNGTEVL